MTTKQILLSILILGATTNISLAIDNERQHTSTHILGNDYIILKANFERSSDGKCHLHEEKVNRLAKEANIDEEKFRRFTNQMSVFEATPDCGCNLLLVAMENDDPTRLKSLFEAYRLSKPSNK